MLVHKGQMDLKVRLDLKVRWVLRGQTVHKAMRVHKDLLVTQDHKVLKVSQEPLDNRAQLVDLVMQYYSTHRLRSLQT